MNNDSYQSAEDGRPEEQWDVAAIVNESFTILKQHWAPLLLSSVIMTALMGTVSSVPNFVRWFMHIGKITEIFLRLAAILLSAPVYAYLSVGATRIYLAAARGKTPEFSDMFSGDDLVVPMFVAQMAVWCATFIGFMFFVIPGIIAYLGLSLVPFYIVDMKMKPLNALEESWRVTNGQKFKIFIFIFAVLATLFFGCLLCCFGSLISTPFLGVGMALIYIRLTGRGASVGDE